MVLPLPLGLPTSRQRPLHTPDSLDIRTPSSALLAILRENIRGAKTTPDATTIVTSSLVNVTSGVQVTSSGFLYSRATRTFNGTITVTTLSSAAIPGPLQIGFGGLPAGVTLADTTTANGGIPFISLPGGIGPRQSVSFTVQFSNPSNVSISYSPIVYSGAF